MPLARWLGLRRRWRPVFALALILILALAGCRSSADLNQKIVFDSAGAGYDFVLLMSDDGKAGQLLVAADETSAQAASLRRKLLSPVTDKALKFLNTCGKGGNPEEIVLPESTLRIMLTVAAGRGAVVPLHRGTLPSELETREFRRCRGLARGLLQALFDSLASSGDLRRSEHLRKLQKFWLAAVSSTGRSRADRQRQQQQQQQQRPLPEASAEPSSEPPVYNGPTGF